MSHTKGYSKLRHLRVILRNTQFYVIDSITIEHIGLILKDTQGCIEAEIHKLSV